MCGGGKRSPNRGGEGGVAIKLPDNQVLVTEKSHGAQGVGWGKGKGIGCCHMKENGTGKPSFEKGKLNPTSAQAQERKKT